jgi:hypothetical protein
MTRHSQDHEAPVAASTAANGRHTHLNRAQLLAAGAGLVLAAVPTMAMVDTAAAHEMSRTAAADTVQDILDVLVTMGRFGVAAITAGLTGTIQPGLHRLHIPIEQAAVAAFLAQVEFWESLGGHSLTNTFSLPAAPGESTLGLQGKENNTELYVGAFTAATRQFAELGKPLLATYASQTAGVYAEHRALARAVQVLEGVSHKMPPPNKAFESDSFHTVRDVYNIMLGAGLFGRLPFHLPYPSRAAVLAAAGPMAPLMIQKTPLSAPAS